MVGGVSGPLETSDSDDHQSYFYFSVCAVSFWICFISRIYGSESFFGADGLCGGPHFFECPGGFRSFPGDRGGFSVA